MTADYAQISKRTRLHNEIQKTIDGENLQPDFMGEIALRHKGMQFAEEQVHIGLQKFSCFNAADFGVLYFLTKIVKRNRFLTTISSMTWMMTTWST